MKVITATSAAIGRSRAIRATRFVSNALRFDEGTMETNGELLVQQVALSRPNPVVFDVGANVGQWSTALLGRPGYQPQLHLFEPSSYSSARAGEAMGDRAQVHSLALSSERGEADLYVVKDGDKTNSLVPVDRGKARTTEKVLVETVDHFSAEWGISEITLLKIDAEGHDLKVIRGASEMLGRGAIAVVQFEYNWLWTYSRTYLRDVFDLVKQYPDYTVAKLGPAGIELHSQWHPELETFRSSNYVLVRNDWCASFPTIAWWGG